MPIYVYGLQEGAKEKGCDVCRACFEITQRMSDKSLEKCPECGAPIEKRILAPNITNVGNLKGPTDGQLAGAGFTQYRRKGKGYYEKSFGSGPGALGKG